MKIQALMFSAAVIVALAACTKPGNNPEANPDIKISTQTTVEVPDTYWTQEVVFTSELDWTAETSVSWISASPVSGTGSAQSSKLTLSIEANTGSSRTGTVTISNAKSSAVITVNQKEQPTLTIAEFISKPVSSSEWYRLSGKIAAIASESYGNFYITDETGYVLVYGLCTSKVGSNDQSFKELGLKPGDTVTMMTLRSEHNGTVEAGGSTAPAYYVSHVSGDYDMGSIASSASQDWMELPATSASDGQDFLVHRLTDGSRSYSLYWDYSNLVASWVAYPLFAGNIGSGDRTDAWAMDPLLPRDSQPVLEKAYKAGNGGAYDRGHQIPSADRLNWRANMDTFFGTNMTPQDNTLNAGLWATIESKLRNWAKNSATDTLYVVSGCVVDGSTLYSLDNDGKKVTVPVGYYKALLRLAKDRAEGTSGYTGLALYLENTAPEFSSFSKTMTMSIDALEELTGLDFFVNLPEDVEAAVEAQVPSEFSWWWNN